MTPAQAEVMLNGGFRCKVVDGGNISAFFHDRTITHSSGDWELIGERMDDIGAFIANHRREIDDGKLAFLRGDDVCTGEQDG